MGRRETLERERRWARPAGLLALAAGPLYIVALFLVSSRIAASGLPTEQVRVAAENSTLLQFAAILSGLGAALFCIPLLNLFKAAQARSDRVSPAMIGFVFIGPLLMAVQLVISGFSQAQISTDFVSQASAGGDVYTLLEDVADDSTLTQIGGSLYFPAVLGLLVAMIYIPLQAMRVGLLTRFFATFGMALGASLILIAPQIALLAISLWMGWLGLVFLDRVPRGAPPAWEAGEPIPWLRPGEEPAEPASEEAVEGDATEVFGGEDEPAPDHSARRDRARKRKRKRRR